MLPVLTVYAPADKDKTRVAAGLKAALHNPNVGDEAKERAAQKLDSLDGESILTDSRTTDEGSHDAHRVLGGYKATLTVGALLGYCRAQ